jgi:hypothetical protein
MLAEVLFKHDGAPVHCFLQLRHVLKPFAGHVNVLDFFLWECIKEGIYATEELVRSDLICRILVAATDIRGQPRPEAFNLFCSRTPKYNLSSTLYHQSCWCIIRDIHNL